MDYATTNQIKSSSVTDFGGLMEDFDDLYWEASLSARRTTSSNRRTLPNLSSQIEDYFRTGL
jgi:hypothetical protein